MADVVRLAPGAEPDTADLHVLVEADNSGLFFGTGCGVAPDGATAFYISLSEDDVSLEAAVSAAIRWADSRGVDVVQVQTTPPAG